MRETYSPQTVEAEVQAAWKKADVYHAHEHAKDKNGKEKPKFYVLSMLPYPSGKLHMGHVRNYTLKRRDVSLPSYEGYNVMTRWDGMPSVYRQKTPPLTMALLRPSGLLTTLQK